jgi:hypothetical protein
MFHVVRILGVAYASALTFVAAWLFSTLLDKVTPQRRPEHSRLRTFLEICVQFGLIGIIGFLSRGLIKKIPFPFDGAAGYIHSQLNELRTLPLFVFIFMFFQVKTQEKMRFLMGKT